MELIRSYVWSVILVAGICGMIPLVVGKKGAVAGALGLVSEIVMVLTLLSPLRNVQIPDLPGIRNEIFAEADRIVDNGTEHRTQQLFAIIKSKTEAYICDKAAEVGAQLRVTVELTNEALPVPASVVIKGSVSPYGKTKLSRVLQEELGIPTEAQTWISDPS